MFNIIIHSHLAFLATSGHILPHEKQLYSWQSKESMWAGTWNE